MGQRDYLRGRCGPTDQVLQVSQIFALREIGNAISCGSPEGRAETTAASVTAAATLVGLGTEAGINSRPQDICTENVQAYRNRGRLMLKMDWMLRRDKTTWQDFSRLWVRQSWQS